MANNDNNSSKIIRGNMSRWSGLPKELLEVILSASSLKSIIRLKAICPSWSAAVEEITMSPSFSCLPETAWLVLPRDLNRGEAMDCSRFFSLEGNLYVSSMNIPDESRDAVIVGSSHGWLVILNKRLEFMITNPLLSGIQLPLPPLKTFPDVVRLTFQKGTKYAYNIVDHFTFVYRTVIIERPPDGEEVGINKEETLDFTSLEHFASKMIAKAVLSSRPTCSNKDNIGVMVIYSFGDDDSFKFFKYNNLAFCTTSDYKWTKLEERRWYREILGCKNEFYVLKEDFSIDIWCFLPTYSNPEKRTEIKPAAGALKAPWCPKVYMIKTASNGIMLVVEFPLRFSVFKLERMDPVWKEMQSIGSNALVLGSSNSIVMSSHDSLCCDSDSIYYVKKSRRGSYDLHVFSLMDKSRKRVRKLPVDFEPLAFSGS